jgi:hypothetical protein
VTIGGIFSVALSVHDAALQSPDFPLHITPKRGKQRPGTLNSEESIECDSCAREKNVPRRAPLGDIEQACAEVARDRCLCLANVMSDIRRELHMAAAADAVIKGCDGGLLTYDDRFVAC